MLFKSLLNSPAYSLAVVLSLLVGCNGATQRPKVVEVKGQVFLGEQPLAFGQVIFQPIQGGQPASGEINSNGSFSLGTFKETDGAIVGRHKVRVVAYSSQDPDNPREEISGDALGDLLIPSRYASFATSGIEVSVLESGNAPFILKLDEALATQEVEQLTSEVTDLVEVAETAKEDSVEVTKKLNTDSAKTQIDEMAKETE